MQSNLRVMLAAKFVSEIGTWIHSILLLLLLNEVSKNVTFAISAVLGLKIIVGFLTSPLIGRFVDKNASKGLMVAADFICALVVLVYTYTTNTMVIGVVSVILGIITTIHYSTFNIFFHREMEGKDMKGSLVKLGMTQEVTMVLGTIIGVLLAQLISLKFAFIFDAASFVVSGIFLSFLNNKAIKNEEESSVREQISFVESVKKSKGLFALIAVSGFFALTLGYRDVLEIQYLINEKALSKLEFGLLFTMAGIGGLIVNLFIKKVDVKSVGYESFAILLLIMGALTWGFANVNSLFAIFSFTLILGAMESLYFFLRSQIFFSNVHRDHIGASSSVFKTVNASCRSIGVILLGLAIGNKLPSIQFEYISGIYLFGSIGMVLWLASRKEVMEEKCLEA